MSSSSLARMRLATAARAAALTAAADFAQSAAGAPRDGHGDLSADGLAALPTANWPTNGGNLYNQRYSPLTAIDRANVARAQRRVARAAARLGHRAAVLGRSADRRLRRRRVRQHRRQRRVRDVDRHRRDPLAVRSAVRIRTSPRSAAAGTTRASRSARTRSSSGGSTAGSSRSTARPGKPVWAIQAERWQENFSITAAPALLRRHGHHRVSPAAIAARAAASRPTTPRTAVCSGPSTRSPAPASPVTRPGRRTTTRGSTAAASIWQTPAVDPELGLIYFSTGNAGPDYNGAFARRRQPLRGVDASRSSGDRQVPLALPAGASRHLGLRRGQSRRPDGRERRRPRRARRSPKSARPAGPTSSTARPASR